jgi:aromatic ring-cleaving dioxygenase
VDYFHAHIYWENKNQRNLAISLRDKLRVLGCSLGQVIDKPIGPHTLPMYQVNYSSKNATEVEEFLSNKGLSILLHYDTGNHMEDHTKRVRWIGEKLDLDLVFFNKIK